jgi:type II secretory pathway pseudopilin PulG
MTTRNEVEAGFSLVELIVYTAIMTIVVSSLTLTGVSLLRTFGYMQASADVAETATVALERITREVRFAYNVDTGASTLLVSPGVLVLGTTDESGNPTTITITLDSGRIWMTQGGGVPSPLTRDSVEITNLVFTHTVGTHTQAVRIDMTAERTTRDLTITKEFRTFVVLDAS